MPFLSGSDIRRTRHGSDGLKLLLIAGVHGDEFEPMLAVRRLWDEFQRLPLRGEVTLIPIVNQPAFQRGQRTADDERDLARTMPGRIDGTVTEQIAAALAPLIREADLLIDLHTGGRVFEILPLAGYVLHPDRRVLDQQRRMARAFNLPIIWGTCPQLEGRTLSVARDANVPAIYVEACGGPTFQPHAVSDCVTGCLNVAAEFGLIPPRETLSRIEHYVEDARDSSGHMQILHPAPASGWFEATVALGDSVVIGQILGRVLSPCGDVLGEIPATERGLVLFQRAIPSLRQGDSIAGILPIHDWSLPHSRLFFDAPDGSVGRENKSPSESGRKE